jgi:hypothetical protein
VVERGRERGSMVRRGMGMRTTIRMMIRKRKNMRMRKEAIWRVTMEMTRMEKKRKMRNGRLVSVFVSSFVRIAHTQLVTTHELPSSCLLI